jgi:spore maturation protein B
MEFRDILTAISFLLLPALLCLLPLYALFKKVDVYGEFVEGAKDGFYTAVRIMPFLVGLLFAIGMFRASGAMDVMTDAVRPLFKLVDIPAEILPMAIIRPMSGGGSLAVLGDIVKVHGAESFIARVAGTIYGSAETTFYVLAVYFGAVGIKKTRHAVPAGLIADMAGVFLAVWAVRMLLGA